MVFGILLPMTMTISHMIEETIDSDLDGIGNNAGMIHVLDINMP